MISMKNKLLILISLLISITFSGCLHSVYYSTELDPTCNLKKENRFKVFLPKNPTIEDKKFMISLEKKLIKHGYNIVDNSVDFGIFFTLTEKSYSGTESYTSYVPTTSYTSGYVGNTYVSGSTTSTQAVSNTYSYTDTYKKIYVKVVSSSKNEQGSYETVWNGFMSTKIEEYNENPEAMLEETVKLIGSEFKGYIDVELDTDSK